MMFNNSYEWRYDGGKVEKKGGKVIRTGNWVHKGWPDGKPYIEQRVALLEIFDIIKRELGRIEDQRLMNG